MWVGVVEKTGDTRTGRDRGTEGVKEEGRSQPGARMDFPRRVFTVYKGEDTMWDGKGKLGLGFWI